MTHPIVAPAEELAAIDEGRASVDLTSYRKVRVHGGDARRWLHDLITTDVAALTAGGARRTLLLDPTGHIRADLQVACAGDDEFWLFQAEDQTDHIAAALAPYVLSSDVRIEDLTDRRRLIAMPGTADALGDERGYRPSVLGEGRDVFDDDASRPETPGGPLRVSADAVEVWRIRHGRARMGRDFDRSSLPAEAGLLDTIDQTKGCFLGQESVARVRNLGHPPRVLLHLFGDGRIDVGEPLLIAETGVEAGAVTSAAQLEGGTVALALVRWSAREAPLRTASGLRIDLRSQPD